MACCLRVGGSLVLLGSSGRCFDPVGACPLPLGCEEDATICPFFVFPFDLTLLLLHLVLLPPLRSAVFAYMQPRGCTDTEYTRNIYSRTRYRYQFAFFLLSTEITDSAEGGVTYLLPLKQARAPMPALEKNLLGGEWELRWRARQG